MLLRAAIFAPLLLVLGCAGAPDDDASFRDAQVSEGNGDLSIWLGPVAAQPDIIIYDIQNGFVYHGQQTPDNLILNVHDGEILDATNTEVYCAFDGDELVDAETGEVVLRVQGKVIFEGDDGGPGTIWLKHEHIYEGPPVAHNILATASVEIADASDTRKLLIGALMTANCGAPEFPRE